jgi:hypothetical protein
VRTTVAQPVASPLVGVAAVGETVWVIGARGFAARTGSGAWRTGDLPEATNDYNMYALSPAVLAPLGGGRLLILRAVAGDGTEVFVLDGDQIAATAKFDWKIGPAVTDGRGGAWAIATRGYSTQEKSAYVHFDGTAWRSWSFDGLAIDGMADAGKSAAFPHWLVAAQDGGFVGIDRYNLWFIAADGSVTRNLSMSFEESFRNDPLCATADRRLDIVVGQFRSEWRDPRPTAPILVRFDRVGGARLDKLEAQVPRWWKREHESSTPWLRCSASGGVTWILAPDAAFRRDHERWTTITSRGAEAEAPPATQVMISMPLGAGGSSGPNGAVSLRPELIVAPNRTRPSWGLGAFGELARAGDATFVGGGATGVLYGRSVGTALSFGVDARLGDGRTKPQLVFSGFVGFRGTHGLDLAPLEAPFGVRFDVRPATSEAPATFSVMLSLDTLASAVVVGELLSLLHPHD